MTPLFRQALFSSGFSGLRFGRGEKFFMVRRCAVAALALSSGLLWSSLSHAEILFNGTFTSGSTSAWSKAEEVSPDRLFITNDPLGQRGKVLRVTVDQGDNPINASGNRNELAYQGDMPTNAERYYHWATMWPSDYVSPETWQLFTQFHHNVGGGPPPVQFFAWGEQIILQVNSVQKWAVPLQRGQWHDFVFHVFWSSDPSKGYIELWYDGGHVIPLTPVATLYPGTPNYLKEGLYRNASVSQQQILYQQGALIGTSLDDVWPIGQTGMPAALSPASASQPAMTPDQVADFRQKAGCTAAGAATWPVLALALGFLALRERRRLAAARVVTKRLSG